MNFNNISSKTINPYDIGNVIGEKSESIASNGKFSFTIKVKNKYHADKGTSL